MAKFYLGHRANSTMLGDVYDQSAIGANLTEAGLGETERIVMNERVIPLSMRL